MAFAPSPELFQRVIPILIAMLALGGLATQGVAIATGRDFMFGFIPKLNPGGARNIPIWSSSIAFAVSAALAAAAAGLTPFNRAAVAKRWWFVAATLAILSAERMAFPSRGLHTVLQDLIGPDLVGAVVVGWALGGLVAFGSCLKHLDGALARELRLAGGVFVVGGLACAAAGMSDSSTGIERIASLTVIMSAGRALELAGATLFAHAMVTYLRSHDRPVVLRVKSQARLVTRREGPDALEICLSPQGVGRAVAILSLALVAVSLVASVLRLLWGWPIAAVHGFVYVDFEGNLPTWWSALLLLACGGAAGSIAVGHAHAGRASWRRWTFLAVVFVVLSADEAASFHELMVLPLRVLLGQNPWLRYPLILPGALAVGGAWWMFGALVWDLPAVSSRTIASGAALFLVGALGVETMGGWYDPEVAGYSLAYIVLASVEEGFEMWGTTLMLTGLLRVIEGSVGPIELSPIATASASPAKTKVSPSVD